MGSCTVAPCYIGGAQGTVTPRTGATAWSSLTIGGAAPNPAVAGTGRMSLGSNAGKLISLNSATGAWASRPGQHGERGARLRQRLPLAEAARR